MRKWMRKTAVFVMAFVLALHMNMAVFAAKEDAGIAEGTAYESETAVAIAGENGMITDQKSADVDAGIGFDPDSMPFTIIFALFACSMFGFVSRKRSDECE